MSPPARLIAALLAPLRTQYAPHRTSRVRTPLARMFPNAIGSQQIVVKHVTVNADQAVVTDTVVTGKPAVNAASSAAVLTDAAEKPMPTLDEPSKPAGV